MEPMLSSDHPDRLSLPDAGFSRYLPQCVCAYAADGRCLLANPALLRWLGRAEADVLGRSAFELWPADLALRETADLLLTLRGDHLEQWENRPDLSRPRTVRSVKFPWIGSSGRPAGMVVVFEEAPVASLSRPEAIGEPALGIIHDLDHALALLREQLGLVERGLSAHPEAPSGGLGLVVVQEVVRWHGGWVSREDAAGGGTRFVLHLPAAERAGGIAENDVAIAPEVKTDEVFPPARVLVLERDPDIRQLTALLLQQGTLRAEAAEGLRKARELAAAGPVDLVLVSSELCSGPSGAALRELLGQVPGAGLLVTTSGQPPDLSAFAPALRGVLHKPYSGEMLVRAVRAALHQAEPP
jgi:CheY-like chemotaxis protein